MLFRACGVRKPIISLGRFAQQGYWSDLRPGTGTRFRDRNPDPTQPNTVAQGREFALCQKDADGTLDDSWSE